MFIRRIVTGGTINSIIEGLSNGKECNYLVVDNPRKELERLSCFANRKIEDGFNSYLKVKYEWNLGQRARVLEVVTKKFGKITIYKFVNMTNFDQHALDLQRIKESLCKDSEISEDNLAICLVASSDAERERIKEMLIEMDIDCDVENI